MQLPQNIDHNFITSWIVTLILTLFYDLYQAVLVLIALIIMDTVTGVLSAIKQKRFSSLGLKRTAKKLSLYFLCLLSVRLMEFGASPIIKTTFISHATCAFLIITEFISNIENLIILGVPLPNKFIITIIKQIKIKYLRDAVESELYQKKYIEDVEEIIKYQIPTLKSDTLKILLDIKFKGWLSVLQTINVELIPTNDNDLLYYKVKNWFENVASEIREKWHDAGISKEDIAIFNSYHQKSFDNFWNEIKKVCYFETAFEKKAALIKEKILILLYQTVIDTQKLENDRENCKICK